MRAARVGLRGVLVVGTIALLAGCPATTLLQLDSEWTDAYQAKMRAESDRDYLVENSSNKQRMLDLSNRAKKAASEMESASAKVAAYRVAILAAWKADEVGETQVEGIGDVGVAECSKLPKGGLSQPRDCALLELVPAFASYDKSARAAIALKRSIGTAAEATSEQQKQAGEILKNMTWAFGKVNEKRGNYLSAEVPNSFHDYLKAQMKRIYCVFVPLYGESALSRAPFRKDKALGEEIIGATKSLQDLGLSTSCP
jgi:hypothetical protein